MAKYILLQQILKCCFHYDGETSVANGKNYNSQNVESPLMVMDNDEEISENVCILKKGRISFINEHFGIIDQKLYFEDSSITRFKVGMFVYYLTYKKAGETKIKKVLSEVEKKSDLDKPTVCMKFEGKISARRGRVFSVCYNENKFELDLNEINAEFIPEVGDWLNIECLIENNDVLILEKVSPLQSNKLTGTINVYDMITNIGKINNDIIFDKNISCISGYIPFPGDLVDAHVIQSDQADCFWRALKVAPSEKSKNRYFKITNDSLNINLCDVIFENNRNGIIVSNKIQISLNFIGEQTELKLIIKNTSEIIQTIIGIDLRTRESQLLFTEPNFKRTLYSHKFITLKFLCTAKCMGYTKELVVIEFETFKIGRWIKIYVGQKIEKFNTLKKNSYRFQEKNCIKTARDSFFNMDSELVVGQRPIKPPAFIANKLPMFEIPEQIAHLFFNEMDKTSFVVNVEIKKLAPSLEEKLHARNYKDKYHALLYLEELAIQLNARQYDVAHGRFVQIDDFLVLEIDNLAERRPLITVGDKIIASNPTEKRKFEGFVHKINYRHLYVKFNQQFHKAYKGEEYDIEILSSRTTFRRYHHAVNLAMENLKCNFLFPQSVLEKKPQVLLIDPEENSLKSLNTKHNTSILNGNPSHEHNYNYKTHDNWNNLPKVLKWFNQSLNELQKLAVKNILVGKGRPLPYLLYGPPGTGKTITLIETILQINKLLPHSCILVVGPSNSAADLIALQLLDSGKLSSNDLVRLVAYRRVNNKSIPERLMPYCMTGDLAREGSRGSKEHVQNGIRMCVCASDIGRHRIIVATCMVVGVLHTMAIPVGHFTHFIIDEAGQATEPETIISLLLMNVKSSQTILAGDPLQLGPCVFSLLSKKYGLSESFFERLINRLPYARDPIGFPETGGYDERLVTRLTYNYRSVPDILHLLNQLFYNSELQPMISEKDGSEVELLKRLYHILPKRINNTHGRTNIRSAFNRTEHLAPAVVFHGVRGQNYKTANNPSWFNPSEAVQVVYYVTTLYAVGLKSNDIGVVTPYIKQGHIIRELMTAAKIPFPKIGSIEEFQGQEFQVVILSAVRSNERGALNDCRYGLGFIASPRRLNVALSRARALLIIIGNPHLLIIDNYWRSVLQYAVEIGGYRGCNLPQFECDP